MRTGVIFSKTIICELLCLLWHQRGPSANNFLFLHHNSGLKMIHLKSRPLLAGIGHRSSAEVLDGVCSSQSSHGPHMPTQGSQALQDKFGGHILRAWAKDIVGRDAAGQHVGRVTLLLQPVHWAQQCSASPNHPFFSETSPADHAGNHAPPNPTWVRLHGPAQCCTDTWAAGAGRTALKLLVHHFTEL